VPGDERCGGVVALPMLLLMLLNRPLSAPPLKLKRPMRLLPPPGTATSGDCGAVRAPLSLVLPPPTPLLAALM
jgi:hypothetical protein